MRFALAAPAVAAVAAVKAAPGPAAETVSEIARKHGGSVVEFNGDGMMAVFKAPQALANKERGAAGRRKTSARFRWAASSNSLAGPGEFPVGFSRSLFRSS